ncbi:MAG: hypothetical protein K9W46_04130 [Candidatus Heimdallarchaeum endolithica]|uniref:Uncharacterized protein n=1 Tax=Candidatus Heimdallarchaeum endolithica TaxID=2876572 RepID=A0A9Y1BSX4_9ARCH|nr:MAG: hypothetical protein K9W46_04130 [Candidatus Heimdallarchaeum endolithica]
MQVKAFIVIYFLCIVISFIPGYIIAKIIKKKKYPNMTTSAVLTFSFYISQVVNVFQIVFFIVLDLFNGKVIFCMYLVIFILCLILQVIRNRNRNGTKTFDLNKYISCKKRITLYLERNYVDLILVLLIVIPVLFLSLYLPLPPESDTKYHSLFIKIISEQKSFNLYLTNYIAPGFINTKLRSYTLLSHFSAANIYLVCQLFMDINAGTFLNIYMRFIFLITILSFYSFYELFKNSKIKTLSLFSLLFLTPHFWYFTHWGGFSELFGFLNLNVVFLFDNYLEEKNDNLFLFLLVFDIFLSFFIHIYTFIPIISLIAALFLQKLDLSKKISSGFFNKRNKRMYFIILCIIVISFFTGVILYLFKPSLILLVKPDFSLFMGEYYSIVSPWKPNGNSFLTIVTFLTKNLYLSFCLGIIGFYFYLNKKYLNKYKIEVNKTYIKILFLWNAIFYFPTILMFQFIKIQLTFASLIFKMERIIPLTLIFTFAPFSAICIEVFTRIILNIFPKLKILKIKKVKRKVLVIGLIVIFSTPYYYNEFFNTRPSYNNDILNAIYFLKENTKKGSIVLNDASGQWIPVLSSLRITFPFITGSEDEIRGRDITLEILYKLIEEPTNGYELLINYSIEYIFLSVNFDYYVSGWQNFSKLMMERYNFQYEPLLYKNLNNFTLIYENKSVFIIKFNLFSKFFNAKVSSTNICY